jgi:hypothetical protein
MSGCLARNEKSWEKCIGVTGRNGRWLVTLVSEINWLKYLLANYFEIQEGGKGNRIK